MADVNIRNKVIEINKKVELLSIYVKNLQNALRNLVGGSAYNTEAVPTDVEPDNLTENSIANDLRTIEEKLADETAELYRLVSILEKTVYTEDTKFVGNDNPKDYYGR